MYQVSDLMTKQVVSVRETDDLALADTVMHFGKFRHVPVTRNGKLVGLISQRDYLRSMARGGEGYGRKLLAGEVMNRDVETVGPHTPLRAAFRLMLRKKYGCVPVIDRRKKLIGILTESDATRFAARVVRDLEAVERAAVAAVLQRA